MLRRYRLLEIETVMRGIVNGGIAANRRFGSEAATRPNLEAPLLYPQKLPRHSLTGVSANGQRQTCQRSASQKKNPGTFDLGAIIAVRIR
jgi:hypothetical protein